MLARGGNVWLNLAAKNSSQLYWEPAEFSSYLNQLKDEPQPHVLVAFGLVM